MITVTDWRGLEGKAAAALLKVWLWTASLRRGWRVELDDVVVAVVVVVVVAVDEEDVC